MTKHGTAIGWTHQPGYKGETWTVLAGCQLADYTGADGKQHGFRTCKGCYAMATAASVARRFGKTNPRMLEKYGPLTKGPIGKEVWNGEIYFDDEQLLWPISAKNPRCFFLTSMGDPFYKHVSRRMRAKIVAVMMMTPQHRYLVLTKRPDIMAADLSDREFKWMVIDEKHHLGAEFVEVDFAAPHIFWGTSIEDQPTADWAMSYLVNVPGQKWVSYEPVFDYAKIPYMPHLCWGVIGGASTQRGIKTPTDLRHMRQLVKDFADAKVPLYVKQMGAEVYDQIAGDGRARVRLENHDNHNADPQHWPAELRVQQFPGE